MNKVADLRIIAFRFAIIASVFFAAACSDENTAPNSDSGPSGDTSSSDSQPADSNGDFSLAFELKSHPGSNSTAMSWGEIGFTPDGKIFAHNGRGTRVSILSPRNGELLLQIPIEGIGLGAVTAFSPDGERILVGAVGIERPVSIFNASSGEELAVLESEHKVRFAVFSPDSKAVITGNEDGVARIWDAANGRLLRVLEGHTGWIVSGTFSPDGKYIATASHDYTTRIWNFETGTLERSLEHHFPVVSVKYSSNGGRIVTSTLSSGVRVWNSLDGVLTREFKLGDGRNGYFADFASGDDYIIALDAFGHLIVWEIDTSTVSYQERTQMNQVGIFDSRSMSLFVVGLGGGARDIVVDLNSLEITQVLNEDRSTMTRAAFNNDGRLLVTEEEFGSSDVLRLWMRQ